MSVWQSSAFYGEKETSRESKTKDTMVELKETSCQEAFRQEVTRILGGKDGLPNEWDKTAEVLQKTAETVLGVTFGKQKGNKETCLFAMIMDRLTDEVRREIPWTMLFANDIVICEETREEVEWILESWRYALERRGMKVNRSKTEYLCVNGGNDRNSEYGGYKSVKSKGI